MEEEREAPSTAAPSVPASRPCKTPDSACSVGNCQSQRSGSSKSRTSNSSGSSGYGGHPSTLSSGNDTFLQPQSKDNDHRKKKLEAEQEAPEVTAATPSSAPEVSPPPPHEKSDAAPTPTTPSGAAPEPLEEAAVATEAAGANYSPSDSNSNAAEAQQKPSGGCLHQAHMQPQQPASRTKDEFTVIVSMQDGAVLYTSPSITQALAFPRDMWLGKSFIDYVHPDDRLALMQHVTMGVAMPRLKGGVAKAPVQAPLLCRLQHYALLRDGFAGVERRHVHWPFSLQLCFHELPASAAASASPPPGVLLTVTATAVCTAYIRPDEKPAGSARFAMRHQADGTLTHVDSEVAALLGYMPHQLVGRPVFDVFHPAELRGLQRVYRQLAVSTDCESPHRLRAHNGCYVRVHTEWSSFVNPWTKRLEFVIGQHCVLQGPSCPDVFAEPQDEEEMLGEDLRQDCEAAKAEILQLLQEEVHRGVPGLERRDVSQRCKDLASFMEALIGESDKPALRVDPAATANRTGASFSERSSVRLGGISPHRDHCDSKASSETPPSYNQLNYDDNIQRFFKSKPKTIPSDDSGERLMALEPTSRGTDEDTKAANGCRATRNCLSPVNDTGSGSNSGSGSGSAGPSGNNSSVDKAEADGDYKPPHLTEALLYRHNEDMEKRMVQRHRDQRGKGGDGDGKCQRSHHCQPAAALPDKAQVESTAPPVADAAAHGTKRGGSHSWDGEPLKASKHSHAPSPPATPPPPSRDEAPRTATTPAPAAARLPGAAATEGAGPNLWPPLHSPQACDARGNSCCCGRAHTCAALQLLPLCYLPAPSPAGPAHSDIGGRPHTHPHGPAAFLQQRGGALPYVAAGVLYQAAPLLCHQPLMHHPSAYQLAVVAGVAVGVSEPAGPQSSAGQHQQLPRPASCATSVKVEPASSAASVAASVLDRGASDGSQESREEETEAEDSGLRSSGQGQSNSSFTYSFLRSDGDSCRDAGAEDMLWERMGNGSSEGSSKQRPVLKDPPWLENVEVTPDLMFRYQMSERQLDTVLKDDLQKLRTISQPMLVDEQLGQLYLDVAHGCGTCGRELSLEEGDSSGNDSGAVSSAAPHKTREKRHSLEYSELVMIFEENAPMPSPLSRPT